MGGRISAAIEILEEVLNRHRPASEALRDWGKSHRFAGSGDRHAIGTLVFDVLRKKNSLAFMMSSDAPRSLVLAAVVAVWKKPLENVIAWGGEEHGFGPLLPAEEAALAARQQSEEAWISGDFPQWLERSFARVFSARAAAEGAALANRAPIDLRVNTLKAERAQVLAALVKFGAVEGPLSPWAIRIAAPGPEEKPVKVEAEPAHGLGWFEVQDAASQVAAMLSGATPGETLADICAGAGGKTLALAAMMKNEGRILAHDADKFRLRPIFERLTRAGVTNAEVIASDDRSMLEAAKGKIDCVVIDAPCSGSGAWRRKPDSKWRFNENLLAQRLRDQRQVLDRGAELTRPGGRLVYITCSVLAEENRDQVQAFLKSHKDYALVPQALRGATMETVSLTPLRHQTDGFFIAVMRRTA